MNTSLRVLLVVCAVVVLFFIARKLSKAQIQVMDSVFWLLFSLSLVILAVFPEIAYALADLLGFQAPVNFVFLYVIAVLLVRDFSSTVKNAQQREKLTSLIQEIALRDCEQNQGQLKS